MLTSPTVVKKQRMVKQKHSFACTSPGCNSTRFNACTPVVALQCVLLCNSAKPFVLVLSLWCLRERVPVLPQSLLCCLCVLSRCQQFDSRNCLSPGLPLQLHDYRKSLSSLSLRSRHNIVPHTVETVESLNNFNLRVLLHDPCTAATSQVTTHAASTIPELVGANTHTTQNTCKASLTLS